MTTKEFIEILLIFLGVNLNTLILGFLVLTIFKKSVLEPADSRSQLSFEIGLSYLIGLGSLGFIGLLLGLFGLLERTNLLFSMLLGQTLGLIYLSSNIQIRQFFLKFNLKQIFSRVDLITSLFILTSTIILITLYYAALLPPHVSDELHYHLPEANLIVQTHTVKFNLDGHYFYGNIPKLIEIIFAEGIILQGYTISHLLQFSILIGFLFLVFGVINKNFGSRTAALAVLLICLYDEFTQNAVTAYVDSATTSFEVGALLLIADWLVTKSKLSFIGFSFLISLALSSKYSPLFTTAFILVIILFYFIKFGKQFWSSNYRLFIIGGLVILLISGYWYIKNLILYQNPTYPLYFGHKGVSEDNYRSLINAIQEFGSRDLRSFLAVPFSYFNVQLLPVFFSFYLAVFSLLIQKSRQFSLILFLYSLSYTSYWFFLATHQTRFLMPSIIVLLILTSIFLTNLTAKKLVMVCCCLILFFLFVNQLKPTDFSNALNKLYVTKFNVFERQYGLGKIPEKTYLEIWFGCQYGVIEYLESNNLSGSVIDNWTVWHDASVPFYARNNKFIHFAMPDDATNSELKKELILDNARFIYFKDDIKKVFGEEKDPVEIEYYRKSINSENRLLLFSDLIYKKDDCHLYQINTSNL